MTTNGKPNSALLHRTLIVFPYCTYCPWLRLKVSPKPTLQPHYKDPSNILVADGGRVTSAGLKSKHLRAKPKKRTSSQPGAGRFARPAKRILVLSLFLVVATVALYYPAIHHPFVNYDDDGYVTENVHVQTGLNWDMVEWAFTSYDQANWHPLTWLSHALDCQLFQLEPAGHH